MFKFHVIGNPINHSSSPMLFKYIFKQLDIDGSYTKKCIKLDSNLKSEIDFLFSSSLKSSLNFDCFCLRVIRMDSAFELWSTNSFISSSSGSAVLTVIEPNHGRSTSDTVRFRKVLGFDGFSTNILTQASGYTITKVDDNSYTFTASSGTATIGNVRGGGSDSTAGPVTIGA